MTEPVAYLVSQEPLSSVRWLSDVKPIGVDDKQITPLYTAEQLHPRVKMTKKQYDRLMWDKGHTNLLACLDYFFVHDDNYKLGLPSENLKSNLTQEDIAQAWLNPDEVIEIIPSMKWFVRSKEKYEADPVQGISESGYLYLTDGGDDYSISYCEMTTFKDEANQFDTKAEAEKWTNPLTEAVQLPVEDK